MEEEEEEEENRNGRHRRAHRCLLSSPFFNFLAGEREGRERAYM